MAALMGLAAAPLTLDAQAPPVNPAGVNPIQSLRPLIAKSYPQDRNRDRIADTLFEESARLAALAKTGLTPAERALAQAQLDSSVDVELIFDQPIGDAQLNAFAALGGRVTYLYRSVSYGWNGRVPLSQVNNLPAAMGGTLVLVDAPQAVQKHLDVATRTGRVRPVWAAGFAGSGGYSGGTNITVAIVDTGVDESHSDLNGRRVYWRDFSTDNASNPIDMDQHGSHVAGIALGTGAAGGAGSGTLAFTQSGTLGRAVPSGSFYPDPIDLPDASVNFNMTARWTGKGTTTLHLASHPKGDADNWGSHDSSSGKSPLSLNTSLTGDSTRAYTPALLSAGNPQVGDFVVTCQVSGYPGVGDGFNKFSGVAPGCNWAGAKVFKNDGTSQSTWIGSALDDLVSKRASTKIKVMNLSLGIIGSPGLSTSLRQKVNTAVNAGIVVVVSAGNDGESATDAEREIDDPGRAAMALTVAAANDVNQLTTYTSQGFTSPGTSPGLEEDYKPDVMAPGGSATYYTSILSVDSNSGDGSSFTDQQANDYADFQGTSMSSPFVAGCAALVIDALEQRGTNWDFNSSQHSGLVKMVLCATASESNTNREEDVNNPTLQRATAGPNGFPIGKDQFEGFGMINPDAAVEAVSTTFPVGTTNITLGSGVTDRRVWASTVPLTNGQTFRANLTVPGSGDFDLYLYRSTPTAFGTPVILASSTQAGNGASEVLAYTPTESANAFLVVKRISGSGTFSLITSVNRIPIALNPSLGTTKDQAVTFSVVKLATDPDGDSMTFTLGSTNGTVSLIGDNVTYTPPAGFTGSETLTYTADDGRGGLANGTVTVTVSSGTAVSLNIVYGPAVVNGDFVVRFAGIPGRTYTVEWSANADGPWSKAINLIAPTTSQGFGVGIFEFSEPTSGAPSRFYRTVYPAY